jgi:hypothetical protein
MKWNLTFFHFNTEGNNGTFCHVMCIGFAWSLNVLIYSCVQVMSPKYISCCAVNLHAAQLTSSCEPSFVMCKK